MAKKARIVIDKNIGEADPDLAFFGLAPDCFSSSDMRSFLTTNADAEIIEVEISSNGGNTTHGFEIYDLLIAAKAEGKTIITIAFKCNSIASVIFLAGDERRISKNAELIIHNPRIDPEALRDFVLTADQLAAISTDVRGVEDQIFNLYNDVLKFDATQIAAIKELMKVDSNLGANAALEYGFATSIIASATMKSLVKSPAYSNAIAALLKENFNSKNTMDMKQISAALAGMNASISALLSKNKLTTKGASFSVIKDGSADTTDGAKIYFEGDKIAVGTPVFSDEALTIPTADGTVETADGDSITIAAGLVTAFVEKDDTAAAEAAAAAAAVIAAAAAGTDVTAENTALKLEVANLKAQIKTSNAANTENKTAIQAMLTKVNALNTLLVDGGKLGVSVTGDEAKLSPAQKALALSRASRVIKN